MERVDFHQLKSLGVSRGSVLGLKGLLLNMDSINLMFMMYMCPIGKISGISKLSSSCAALYSHLQHLQHYSKVPSCTVLSQCSQRVPRTVLQPYSTIQHT